MATNHNETILRSLRRITRAIDLYSRKLANSFKLTGPQLVCLLQLSKDSQTTPSELAKSVALSQATVTGILDRLEVRGLILRDRNPKDKRRVIVKLSDSGAEMVKSAPTPLHEKFARRLAELPEDEQDRINNVLQEVVEMMEAEDIDAAPMLAAGPVTVQPSEVTEFLESNGTEASKKVDNQD